MIQQELNENFRQAALRMTGISKCFGPVQALSKVSFQSKTGSVHALVGENGAGKSTLMKILAGVYQPDEGTIEIGGKMCRFEHPHQALDAGISMIYQELDLAEHLTVAENVFLGNEPEGIFSFTINKKAMIEKTKDLAQSFNFEIDPAAIVEELSTADRQIVEILKALVRKSQIIVMDEPTSSLSEKETGKLFDAVRELRKQNISIIYISHRLEEITGLADDITILRDGRVVHTEPASKLDIPKIVHYMVGRELNEFFPSRSIRIGRPVVKVENLSCGKLINNISFEICSGEIVGMAGLLGAGRTDVARTLFGINKKTSGTFELDGKIIEINSPADAIKNKIAYLTEDRKKTGLCLHLPCSWNITLPNLASIGMKNFIMPKKEQRIVEKIASRISIKWSGPDATVESLSGGNQQKVLIARWLLADSVFLIFDEPTRGIDVGAKKEVYTILNDLACAGKAILFISSELPELFGITDRILVMRRGNLVGSLRTKQTTQEQIMHLAAVEK